MKLKILLFIRHHVSNSRIQRFLEKRIAALSEGYFYSLEIRKLYHELHGLEIGYGTYGGCWNNSSLWWQNITIGRYCSFAPNVYIARRNHPLDWFTMHPITYDSSNTTRRSKNTPPISRSHRYMSGMEYGLGTELIYYVAAKQLETER